MQRHRYNVRSDTSVKTSPEKTDSEARDSDWVVKVETGNTTAENTLHPVTIDVGIPIHLKAYFVDQLALQWGQIAELKTKMETQANQNAELRHKLDMQSSQNAELMAILQKFVEKEEMRAQAEDMRLKEARRGDIQVQQASLKAEQIEENEYADAAQTASEAEIKVVRRVGRPAGSGGPKKAAAESAVEAAVEAAAPVRRVGRPAGSGGPKKAAAEAAVEAAAPVRRVGRPAGSGRPKKTVLKRGPKSKRGEHLRKYPKQGHPYQSYENQDPEEGYNSHETLVAEIPPLAYSEGLGVTTGLFSETGDADLQEQFQKRRAAAEPLVQKLLENVETTFEAVSESENRVSGKGFAVKGKRGFQKRSVVDSIMPPSLPGDAEQHYSPIVDQVVRRKGGISVKGKVGFQKRALTGKDQVHDFNESVDKAMEYTSDSQEDAKKIKLTEQAIDGEVPLDILSDRMNKEEEYFSDEADIENLVKQHDLSESYAAAQEELRRDRVK